MTRTVLLSIALLVLACGGTSSPADTMDAGRPEGAKLYNMNCTLCHGRDGKAGISGAKDLTTSTLSKEEMTAIVSNGKGAMAPYRNVLSPKEIDAVVQHVRSLGKPE